MKSGLILLSLLTVLGIAQNAFCESIQWENYNEGIRLSRKENKKVFLYFRADWCGFCVKMEKTVFADRKIIAFLNQHFISIKVDGDKETSLNRAYKVNGFPDNRFLDELRQEVFKLPGFLDTMTFFFVLEYIHSNSYKTMTPIQYYKSR